MLLDILMTLMQSQRSAQQQTLTATSSAFPLATVLSSSASIVGNSISTGSMVVVTEAINGMTVKTSSKVH